MLKTVFMHQFWPELQPLVNKEKKNSVSVCDCLLNTLKFFHRRLLNELLSCSGQMEIMLFGLRYSHLKNVHNDLLHI